MRWPWSLFGLLLLNWAPLLAAEPANISSVDPLKQPPPVLDRALALETSPVEPEAKIVPSLRERLATAARNEPVRVIVTLFEPRSEPRSGPPEEAERLLARRLAALEHRFARSARAVGFAPERGLSHLPVVIGWVSAADVGRLAALPEVRAIEAVVELRAARVEGGRLVRSLLLRAPAGGVGAGAGVGVAVLDTGVDAEHPELLGAVEVEADFTGTTGSGAVDDNGHGTAVAGIVAGRSGGMAPEATIWAIKVLDAAGEGDSAQTLAALDALYAARNDFGGLRLLNLSFVSSAYATDDSCDLRPFPPGDHFPAESMALSKLREAGVTTFAASGNGGLPAVSFPACLSSAIAVGAVYDADLGPTSFPGLCADAATRADQVPCFSNTGAALDLLAPSLCASTPAPGGGLDECFSGTSAAAPYAAGVAAQLLGLLPETTPAELHAAMAGTGRPVEDAHGLTRNRVDALAAYQRLAGGDGGGDPPPPPGPWLRADGLPGFEAQVVIGEVTPGTHEPDCIAETLCASGALAGRPEVFLKVIGPRPNGYLWAQISRFTPSRVEVWLRRIATGETNHYLLDAVPAASEDVSGLQDRQAFPP
jgi:hypothetical protein